MSCNIVIPYATKLCISSWSIFTAIKARKQETQVNGSATSLRRDWYNNGWAAAGIAPACPSFWMHCRSRTLSARKSLKSTKAPLRAFSTVLAGMGGRAGDNTMGVAFEDGGSAMVGNDVDSSADNDGIDGRRVGLAVAVAPKTATEAGPDGSSVGGAEESGSTEAIDAAGGIEMDAGGRILPTCERENGDIHLVSTALNMVVTHPLCGPPQY